jgi:hypothetical protein
MKRLLTCAAFGLVLAAVAPAQAAQEWGLPEEEATRFEAKVVDLLCELSGDCPPECGGGARQLGLLDDQGVLHLAIKNFAPFSGAAWELVDFCGKRVMADGLFTTNRGYRIFALQFVKEMPEGKWRRANRFVPKWAETYGFDPKGEEAKQWFRNDPRVKALLEKDGVLGLGPEADKMYFESQ